MAVKTTLIDRVNQFECSRDRIEWKFDRFIEMVELIKTVFIRDCGNLTEEKYLEIEARMNNAGNAAGGILVLGDETEETIL